MISGSYFFRVRHPDYQFSIRGQWGQGTRGQEGFSKRQNLSINLIL